MYPAWQAGKARAKANHSSSCPVAGWAGTQRGLPCVVSRQDAGVLVVLLDAVQQVELLAAPLQGLLSAAACPGSAAGTGSACPAAAGFTHNPHNQLDSCAAWQPASDILLLQASLTTLTTN